MSKQCEIVRDLLPLYVDSACSEASKEMIKEHLENCSSCNQIYQKMCSHTSEAILKKEKDGVIIRHEKKEGLRVIEYIFIALALLYAPAILLVSLFTNDNGSVIAMPYTFIVTVLFIYTVPFYFSFIELGRLICTAFEKRKITVGETVFNVIGGILAISMIAIGITATALDLDGLILLELCLASILALNWLISAIVYKKKPRLKTVLTDKTFWICAVILMLVVALAITVPIVFLSTQNIREDTAEFGYSIGYRNSGTEYEGLYFDIGAEEQHSWDVLGKNPSFTVKWVNETGYEIQYDMKCYIYKQTENGWGLCSTDYIYFSDEIHTLNFGETKTQKYSIDGYVIEESGLYKFVTFVDGKAVWVEFELNLEAHKILQ